MKCTNCGRDNDHGETICPGCGTQIQQEWQQEARLAAQPEAHESSAADETAHVKLPRLKKLAAIIIAAAVIIVAAIYVIPTLGGFSYATTKDWIEIRAGYEEVVISGNNNPKFKIDGELYGYELSLDNSKAVVMVDYDKVEGGALWFVTTSGARLISEDVIGYLLADSGNGIAFLTKYNEDDETATLYLYDTSRKNKTEITDGASSLGFGGVFGVAISPDGKSIGYVTDYDKKSYDFTGYIVINGSRQKLGDNMLAAAISDGGKFIYYAKYDPGDGNISLHVKSGQNDNRLASDADSIIGSVKLNKDYSQIIYSLNDDDYRTYISRNGAEREKISGSMIWNIILPRDAQRRDYQYTAKISVFGISDFSGFVGVTSDGLSYYNSKLEPDKIANSDNYIEMASVSNDGKTLHYRNSSSRLSSVRFTSSGAERTDIDKEVYSFAASADGKSVYYVNGDNELYFARRGKTPVKIADDVLAGSLTLSYTGNRVYFLVEYRGDDKGGDLYYSSNGGRKTKVPGAFEVTGLKSRPTNIFYATVNDEYFRSNGNEVFSLFYEEENSLSVDSNREDTSGAGFSSPGGTQPSGAGSGGASAPPSAASPAPSSQTPGSAGSTETTAPSATGKPSTWDLSYTVDAFGDKTDEAVLRGSFTGTFRNTATNSSSLTVYLFVNRLTNGSMIFIRLLEYGNHNATYSSRDEMKMQIKVDDSVKELFIFGSPPNTDLYLNGDAVTDYLYEGKEIACVIDIGNSRYNFTIDGNGFAELYDELS